jgi:hypothetical protein
MYAAECLQAQAKLRIAHPPVKVICACPALTLCPVQVPGRN